MERPRSKTLLYFAPGSRVDMRLRQSDLGQTLTPLGAASCENLTTTLRRLAGAISDFPFPLDLGRLPCHLHLSVPFNLKMFVYFTIFYRSCATKTHTILNKRRFLAVKAR